MNKKELIEKLNNAYDVKSENKNKFIRKIKKSNISMFGFIINQIKYIRFSLFLKLLVFAIVMIAAIASKTESQHTVFLYSIPVNALIFVLVIDSSRNNHMEELEMATRFSLKMVVLARMFISGLMSFVLAIIMSIFTCVNENMLLSQTLYTFFLPYFVTIYLCLKLLRKYRDNGFRYCLILTSIISVLMTLINALEINFNILTNNLFMFLTITIIVILLINEIRNYIKNTEELLWNL